jgi:hypothetical protein
MALVRQAQAGDFQGDVAEGLFQLIAIGGRVVVIRRGCTTRKHGFGFVVVELKTDRIDPGALILHLAAQLNGLVPRGFGLAAVVAIGMGLQRIVDAVRHQHGNLAQFGGAVDGGRAVGQPDVGPVGREHIPGKGRYPAVRR